MILLRRCQLAWDIDDVARHFGISHQGSIEPVVWGDFIISAAEATDLLKLKRDTRKYGRTQYLYFCDFYKWAKADISYWKEEAIVAKK